MKVEFHDLAERILNRDTNYWGNLGYWQHSQDYSSACSALAAELAKAVQLNHGSHIFDAGFGCGDQLLMWLKEYRVASIQGVNYSRSQTELAKKRLHEQGFQQAADLIEFCSVADMAELKLSQSKDEINTVLALDCAYHFPSRFDFLCKSFTLLRPQGKIALSDIVLADNKASFYQSFILRSMLFLSRIPVQNIVRLARYQKQLAEAGFSQIKVRDISEHVFLPFNNWLTQYKAEQGQEKADSPWAWLKYDVTAKFLSWAYRNNILRYVIVSAEKSSQ